MNVSLIITGALSKRQSGDQRSSRCDHKASGCSKGEGFRPKECRQLPEARKGKEMDFPPDPAEGTISNVSTIRLISDFWSPELYKRINLCLHHQAHGNLLQQQEEINVITMWKSRVGVKFNYQSQYPRLYSKGEKPYIYLSRYRNNL